MKIAIALALLLTPVLNAQAPKSFAEGVVAFEKGEWKKAEQLMRETVAANPNESAGTVSISGSWYETYVPHYFLARALAKQGKCEEALAAFAETERQGVTPTISDFARHLRTRGGCKPQAAPAKPQKVIKEATVPFGEEPEPVVTPPSPVVIPKRSEEPARAAEPKPAPPAKTFDRQRLRSAINSYLHGRYEEAIRVLTETQFDDRNAAAEAALFRAAARDALHRIGGETDDALRRAIENDLRTYRELRPNGKPDPRMFSPRFIALTSRE